jgi:hypothetical protein
MSLKECLLCWRGCMSCLKVKNSGSITDENLCPFHSHVFYNRSKLWVCTLCRNSWGIHSCDMMLYYWIIGFWCYKTTHWSHLQESKHFWAFWLLKWDCYIVSEYEKQATQWHSFISQNKYLSKRNSV